MPRFVVIKHTMPVDSERPDHFDIMFEHDGVLLTWESSSLISNRFDGKCTRLCDHRLHYLDFEGAVSGNRGEVKRVDSGTYHAIENILPDTNCYRLHISSDQMDTEVCLQQIEEQKWQISCRPLQIP